MNKFSFIACFLIVIFTGIDTLSATQKMLSAVALGEIIKNSGAVAAIKQLKRSSSWDNTIERIGHGNADWVAIAKDLLSAADAGDAEDLKQALSTSLSYNPAAALKLIDSNIVDIKSICAPLMIEPTKADLLNFINKSTAALSLIYEKDKNILAKLCSESISKYKK